MPLVDEKEPQALALSYVNDASKVDKAKFPKFEAGQQCSTCSLYQGAAAAQGPCPLFPGKNVAAQAWCSAYVKKAG
jgi:High potential iron-sulfur protein